jgi:hypothetical protein
VPAESPLERLALRIVGRRCLASAPAAARASRGRGVAERLLPLRAAAVRWSAGRPIGQYDRLGGAHHARADWHRRVHAR